MCDFFCDSPIMLNYFLVIIFYVFNGDSCYMRCNLQ